ncbi:uncharacterized protein DFL_008107 [Arthrobotrys flagrans]|uniref:Uncharacterized protein n=1 Tax=Arthrobotrys flagrans TaxID=97331 RepID=A0A436ZMX7_ARTFL|nr:hypothetical protein DFL_008107 [Arthrobotrys flagrans]
MQNSSNNTPSRLARGIDEDEHRTYNSEDQTPSGHEEPYIPTTYCPHPHTTISSHHDELSFPLSYRKRAASKPISERSDPISDSGASPTTQIRSPKRHCRARTSSTSSNQSLASTSSEVSLKLERIRKAKQFVDDDHHYYHPTYARHVPITQRASWPLTAPIPKMFQGYPDYIEALDIAIGVSSASVDSGVDLHEYNTEVTLATGQGSTLDMAYIGAWSHNEYLDI